MAARRAAAAQKKPPVTTERRRLLARVHQLRVALGMDEDTYRDALYAMAHQRSAGDMTDSQLMETLKVWSGRLPVSERAPFTSGLRAGSKLREPYQRLIKALWINLHNLAALADGSDKALDAFVQRQSGVAALAVVRADKAPASIEALKDWLRREGLDFGDQIDAHAARASLVRRQWYALHKLGAVRLSFADALDAWASSFLHLGPRSIAGLSVDQLDAVARELGSWLRREKAKADD